MQASAGFQQFGPSGPVNGTIHAASAQQGPVGGIHDGIHL